MSVKLSNAFLPSAYDLEVHVDLSTWTYRADEKVTLRRNPEVESSDEIRLHAATTIDITSVKGAKVLKWEEESQTVVLQLDSIERDEVEVTFQFKHEIQEELRGFYRVRFHHDGEEHRMASTHFEPTAARRFYICQDEPAQRADFTLTVHLPDSQQHYSVLSNGPLVNKLVSDGVASYSFQTVPLCPPYLTACVVGELEYLETVTNGIPIRVYTALGKSSRAQFALDTTSFALSLFEGFFQAKFPLPKLDVVAVPDFPIGGMENWGCITCIDSILVDPATSSLASLKRASELICHEVSHNWFGNLVAISWWEGLWLKEGFASWCGYYASHLYEPRWKCLDDATADVVGALETDMYEHSHPVEVPIADPAHITEIFDSISYDKGMGLVFMLESFLGEKWSSAVAHYINKYQFKDTKSIQLWEALQEASGLPIAEAMQSFTTQMGYPILHVSRVSPNKISVRQQPCKLATTPPNTDLTWTIPITIQGHGETRQERMLRGAEAVELELPAAISKEDFFTLNPKQTGFYRCRYDDATFNAWVEDYARLVSSDKRALISDTHASIQMGFDDYSRLAAFGARVQEGENNTGVLREYCDCVKQFASAFTDEELRKSILKEHLHFLVELANKCTEEDKRTDKIHRTFLINAALNYLSTTHTLSEVKEIAIVEWSFVQVNNFLSGKVYDADTLAACLASYVRLEGSKQVTEKNEELWERYAKEDGNDELCRALLQGLLSGSDTNFVKNLCIQCVENKGIRNHFGGIVFVGMCSNPHFQRNEVWSFFKDNFPAIDRQWGGGQFRIQVIVSRVASTLHGEENANDFAQFFKTHPLPNARLAIGRAIENIQLRSWLEKKWTGVLKKSLIK